tara:strand:+ start:950 stop:1135 length:186 start_codon:yes stop_codon:yes gene_type:complete
MINQEVIKVRLFNKYFKKKKKIIKPLKRRTVKGFYGYCKECGKEIGDKRRNICDDCMAFEV